MPTISIKSKIDEVTNLIRNKEFKKATEKLELIKDTQLRTGGLIFAIIGFVIVYYIKN